MCVCMYMYVFMCVCMHVRTYVRMYTCVCVRTFVSMYARMYCARVCVRACMHAEHFTISRLQLRNGRNRHKELSYKNLKERVHLHERLQDNTKTSLEEIS